MALNRHYTQLALCGSKHEMACFRQLTFLRMYHGRSQPPMKVYSQLSRKLAERERQSALRLALIEFAVVFVSEAGWNLSRKTGHSRFDAFGIALLTAVFLYAFHKKVNE